MYIYVCVCVCVCIYIYTHIHKYFSQVTEKIGQSSIPKGICCLQNSRTPLGGMTVFWL